ncbi:MAG TPA: HD domain-containing protein [Anaerolineae bacterium]|nr:HD domain-containing protein [Anaerolineae bacterium]
MDPDAVLDFLRQTIRLKWVVRTGWMMRGVADPESVAEHAWGVALVALVLAEGVEEPLDREKLLTIALLHDLPEAVLSDIPMPALRHLPQGVKRRAEEEALARMLVPLPGARRLREWWQEYEEGSSPEGRLVRDADRLEMLLQAALYEETRGARLEEFWSASREFVFFFPLSQALYRALVQTRAG